MGLDQYIEVKAPSETEWKEYQYYRKFNELQGWFEREYDQENCDYTDMTKEVINALLLAIDSEELIPTEGFFYGCFKATEEDFQELKELLLDMLDKCKDGYKFRYTCWY